MALDLYAVIFKRDDALFVACYVYGEMAGHASKIKTKMGCPEKPLSVPENGVVSGVERSLWPSDLVFGCNYPLRIGSVFRDGGRRIVTDAHLNPVPDAALYIVAEATEIDWRRSIDENGGDSKTGFGYRYYYFVSTD